MQSKVFVIEKFLEIMQIKQIKCSLDLLFYAINFKITTCLYKNVCTFEINLKNLNALR
jgi:hypothetical protein